MSAVGKCFFSEHGLTASLRREKKVLQRNWNRPELPVSPPFDPSFSAIYLHVLLSSHLLHFNGNILSSLLCVHLCDKLWVSASSTH